MQTVILTTLEPETQRTLVGLVFNGVATPDPAQRGAVVGLCAGVAAVLGPTWAAQEVLGMCTKQVRLRGGSSWGRENGVRSQRVQLQRRCWAGAPSRVRLRSGLPGASGMFRKQSRAVLLGWWLSA